MTHYHLFGMMRRPSAIFNRSLAVERIDLVSRIRQTCYIGAILKNGLHPLLVFHVLWLAVNPVCAAEYYRWVDDSGVLHITDNLHEVPSPQRGNINRVQAPESPRVVQPEIKPPPRKASIPMEKHGQVVIIQATLNNKQSAKFVVDTGSSYTLISNALARELSIDVGPNPKTLPFQTANGLIQAPVTNLDSSDMK